MARLERRRRVEADVERREIARAPDGDGGGRARGVGFWKDASAARAEFGDVVDVVARRAMGKKTTVGEVY